eukprot:11746651-Ditylum_brightwellii.AAC.1
MVNVERYICIIVTPEKNDVPLLERLSSLEQLLNLESSDVCIDSRTLRIENNLLDDDDDDNEEKEENNKSQTIFQQKVKLKKILTVLKPKIIPTVAADNSTTESQSRDTVRDPVGGVCMAEVETKASLEE